MSLLLKELMRQGGSRVEKVTQEAIDAWFESMTRLQNKYKEDLFANVNRSASFQCNGSYFKTFFHIYFYGFDILQKAGLGLEWEIV